MQDCSFAAEVMIWLGSYFEETSWKKMEKKKKQNQGYIKNKHTRLLSSKT